MQRRRPSLKSLAMALLLLFAGGSFAPVYTQETGTRKIGLSLPLTGRFAAVAKQVEFGAQAALQAHNAGGSAAELVLFDDKCDAERALEAAKLYAAKNVSSIIGPLCYGFAKALAVALKEIAAPISATPPTVFTLETRNPDLARARAVEELALASLSKPHDAEASAIVDLILPRIADRPFAILDDGSIYGRGLSDAVRLKAEQAGLKPVVTANFRPLQTSQRALLRRLSRSGVEALFVASAPEDIVTIATDMNTLNLSWPIATGETALLLPFAEGASSLPDGVLAITQDVPQIMPSAVPTLPQTEEEGSAALEGPVLLGYT
ncbi:MAG: ABC transporter substrate-binding protein, partial [Pseudomonadota bacterium]